MGFLHQRGGKANLQGGTKSVQDGGSTTIARRKRAFQVFPVTWESDRESKRQISDLQYPKIRRYEAVDGLFCSTDQRFWHTRIDWKAKG